MQKSSKVMLASLAALAGLIVCLKIMSITVTQQIIEHKVIGGETMWGIANAYYPLTNTGMLFAEYEYRLRHMNEHLQPALGAGFNGSRVLQPGDIVQVPIWTRK